MKRKKCKYLTPYFALDIETTGLDPEKNQILEIACIFDPGIDESIGQPLKPISELSKFHVLINNDALHFNATALRMNIRLLCEILSQGGQSPSTGIYNLTNWIEEHTYQGDNLSPIFAGKNLASFDFPFLKSYGFEGEYHHRIIDVGSMYLSDFGYVPSLDEINRHIGQRCVQHRAIKDCEDVIRAIRHKFGFGAKNI